MAQNKPKIIVFDLDYTLWPFWIDTHVTPPFKFGGTSKQIIDSRGCKVQIYEQVPSVLQQLHKEGYDLAVASRTSEIEPAKDLMKLLNWSKYFKYIQIFPGCKVTHFHRIQKESGINFNEMIFFDDEQRNITDVSKIGVFCILVKNGITHAVVNDALTKFANQR